MKEALGGISLFQIVILFVLLFTGIMCLTINQSKAYAVKDEIITIIENAPLPTTGDYSFDEKTSKSIAAELHEAGYRTTGKCPSDKWIAYNRDGISISDKNNASFCIKANNVAEAFKNDLIDKCLNGKCNISTDDYPNMVYYDVALFYELDIPVVKYFMSFKIYGSTKILYGGKL